MMRFDPRQGRHARHSAVDDARNVRLVPLHNVHSPIVVGGFGVGSGVPGLSFLQDEKNSIAATPVASKNFCFMTNVYKFLVFIMTLAFCNGFDL